MIVDCHVHVSALVAGHGSMSDPLLRSLPFRFMRWKFGLVGADASTEQGIVAKLAKTIAEARPLDAAVILAFDGVHDGEGNFDRDNTHLYVTNDFVMELAAKYPQMLFGASVHPYRKDAVAEIERCAAGGAVLMKWLPIVQDFDPADDRCLPYYEALAHYKIPLLAHTGGEQSLPRRNDGVADPMLLVPALKRGVTVIAAHCGTKSTPFGTDYVPQFMKLAHEYEHFYGDTSALNLPTRWYAYDAILKDKVVREKLVHGSDWPIIALPRPSRIGWGESWHLMSDDNWMRRDIDIKQHLGFDDAYWRRAAKILRLPK